MNPERLSTIQPFVGLPYEKSNGPFLLHNENFDPKEGVNCQLLIHLLYRERLGIELPIGMWSKEIYEDNMFFESINKTISLREADIFVFTSEDNKSDPTKYHLTYFTGIIEDEQPLLIHANFLGTSEIWPFERFIRLKRYRELVAIKRLKNELFSKSRSAFMPGNTR